MQNIVSCCYTNFCRCLQVTELLFSQSVSLFTFLCFALLYFQFLLVVTIERSTCM